MAEVEMTTMQGSCKYCGEIQPVMAMDQIDADEKISEKCDCGGAVLERKRLRLIENLKYTVGSSAAENGFRQVTTEQEEIIEIIAMSVLKGHLESASCRIENSTIGISMTANGKVKVKRTDTKDIKTEA